jgi:hypothetical protein
MTLKAAAFLIATVLAATAAQAATTIDTAGFSLTAGGDWSQLDLNVLSDANGTVRIALANAGPQPLDSSDNGEEGDFVLSTLAAQVRAGYRITSFTLSGTATGSLMSETYAGACTMDQVPYCVRTPAALSNYGSFFWSIDGVGGNTPLPTVSVTDLSGTTSFSQTAAVNQISDFSLILNAYAGTTAHGEIIHIWDAEHDYSTTQSAYSSFAFRDVVLTVQVSAVPEPGSYAMLLAGLGLVAGIAARRRK